MEENMCVQTSRNPKIEREERMKINFLKLHAQRNGWQPHGRLSLCWNFYCVDDYTKIDLEYTQIICCIFCYQEHVK
jgi:hypothetical protein